RAVAERRLGHERLGRVLIGRADRERPLPRKVRDERRQIAQPSCGAGRERLVPYDPWNAHRYARRETVGSGTCRTVERMRSRRTRFHGGRAGRARWSPPRPADNEGDSGAMASIRHEIVIDAPPEFIWDVVRDVGAVHERLLPGRVLDTRIDGDQRFLT